jgi:hypothetical protein
MKRDRRLIKVGKVQMFWAMVLVLCFTIPTYSRVENSEFNTEHHEVAGITDHNNVVFAFDRYILTAPFAPAKPITETTRLADLENNRLLIFDAKKIQTEPQVISLGDCYFPTKVFFDEESRMVFIKGTQIVANADGEYEASAVIKYLQLSFPEDGKFNPDVVAQTIPISGVTGKLSTDSPDVFILSKKIFIFTNGATIFTYSLDQGYLYQVPFITPNTYDPEKNAISGLSLDPESRVLSIVISKKEKGEGEKWEHSTELFLYYLAENGTIDQLSHILPGEFQGAALSPGSSIAINGDGKTTGSAYFVASNGKLYQTSWNGVSTDTGVLNEVTALEGFTQTGSEFLSSVTTSYNKEAKVFEIIKNGYAISIHRPLNGSGRGKIGRIHRPLNLRFTVEEPSLTLVQISGRKNRVIQQRSFFTELEGQGGIANLFSDDSGRRYLATYNGNILELSKAAEPDASALQMLGQIGDRLGGVFYMSSRNAIVGLNAMQVEEEEVLSPGGLTYAKRREGSNYLSFVNWAGEVLSNDNLVLGLGIGSIRRPCNTRPQ